MSYQTAIYFLRQNQKYKLLDKRINSISSHDKRNKTTLKRISGILIYREHVNRSEQMSIIFWKYEYLNELPPWAKFIPNLLKITN